MTRIIHITDLHFWRIVYNPLLLINKRFLGNLNLILHRQRYVRQERAQSFIDLFPKLNADALLIGGDMTTTATEVEYQMATAFVAALGQLGIPIYIVPGNHDFYTFESLRHKRFCKHFGERLEHPWKPRLTFLPGGAPLLILPTARPNILSSRGHITPKQIHKAKELIEQTPAGRIVVLAHYPVLPNPVHHTNIMRRMDNATALRQMLGDTDRTFLYLAGHVHVFSRDCNPRFPKLEQVTSSALFYDKPPHKGGFTEITFNNTTTDIRPWHYENGWEPVP